MKCKQIFALLLEKIREMLDSEAFLDEFRISCHFSRKRKLTMKNVVSFMMFHSRRSLRRKLDLLRELLPSADIPRVSRQALSKARHGIRHTLFKKIFDTSVALYYGNIASRRRWLGKYHLFAIDGSDLETPGSESSFEEFGSQSDPKNPELFWSMALASTVYDVLEDIIVDAQIDAQFTNERDLAAMHIARMSELGITENSIVIYDRGYYSAEMFKLCVDSGCFCLMRLHNNMKICRLDGDDVTTTVKAPDGTEIECRVLKILLSSGETEHLITNIMDTDLDCDLFRELYFERWKIESKYYEMKEHWKIEEFSGRSALSVRQDFYITMLHINMASLIKREADEVIETTARPKNKHKYKADRADIIGGLSTRFIRWIFMGYDMSKIEEFILYAAGNRIMVKPGRSRPRKRPTRARKHYENRKTVC